VPCDTPCNRSDLLSETCAVVPPYFLPAIASVASGVEPWANHRILSTRACWIHWRQKSSNSGRTHKTRFLDLTARSESQWHQGLRSTLRDCRPSLVISRILSWNRHRRSPVEAREGADRRNKRSSQTQTTACRRRHSANRTSTAQRTSVCRPIGPVAATISMKWDEEAFTQRLRFRATA